MSVVCVICTEQLLLPDNEKSFIPCGHTFHSSCLNEWLQRSKTCPQCRVKVHPSKVHRIYFNYSNNDSIGEDSTVLKVMVESLQSQLSLKERESKTQEKENLCLKNQLKLLEHSNKGMEIRKMELEKLAKLTELNYNKLEAKLATSESKRLELERKLNINQQVSEKRKVPPRIKACKRLCSKSEVVAAQGADSASSTIDSTIVLSDESEDEMITVDLTKISEEIDLTNAITDIKKSLLNISVVENGRQYTAGSR